MIYVITFVIMLLNILFKSLLIFGVFAVFVYDSYSLDDLLEANVLGMNSLWIDVGFGKKWVYKGRYNKFIFMLWK